MIYLLLCLFYVLALRGAYLALGRGGKKLAKWESFLLYQKLSAIVLIILFAISLYLGLSKICYLALVNLLLLFFFYLQPTPRITKIISIVFVILNLGFLLWNFI